MSELTAYLIQRARFESRPHKVGIDSIIQLDYMGSSEFEFGELPKSLSRIRTDFNDYIYLDFKINEKSTTVFCKHSVKDMVLEYLKKLSNNEFTLKEYSDFNNFVNSNKKFNLWCRTDFWWDIENDLMFWKKDSEFEMEFRKVIEKKKEN